MCTLAELLNVEKENRKLLNLGGDAKKPTEMLNSQHISYLESSARIDQIQLSLIDALQKRDLLKPQKATI